MSKTASSKTTETDWARLDAMTDDEIDTSDIPPVTDEKFRRGVWRNRDAKTSVTLDIDAVVLAWFKNHGEDWQDHIRTALRAYMRTHVRDQNGAPS